MTLLFFDGFQDANAMPKPEWDVTQAFNATVAGRDGTPSSGAGITANTSKTLTLPSPASICYAGIACQYSISGGFGGAQATHRILGFVRSGTVECIIMANVSGMIELRRTNPSGALLATSSGHSPLLAGAWHSYQVKCVLHATAGTFELRLDGVTVINYSGTTAGTTGDVTGVSIGQTSPGALQWDDMWVCDGVDATATQGAANNGFLGDLKVSTLVPTAEGDTLQFTPSTGTAHFSLVDENPVNTTDYVSSPTVGQRDLFNVGDLPAAATSPIAVRVGIYAQKSDAGAASIKTLIKENGTLSSGAVQPLLTTWAGFYGAIRTKKPSNDTPWTVADINGLQVGVEVA